MEHATDALSHGDNGFRNINFETRNHTSNNEQFASLMAVRTVMYESIVYTFARTCTWFRKISLGEILALISDFLIVSVET